MGSVTSQKPELFYDYDGFVEKFKPKKTTDDCMTPPEIYEVVKDYACERWHIDPAKVVRPFWPGGDYEAFDYPDGAVVIDNPPFSILAKIKAFYLEHGIPFFLFCPSLTALSGPLTNRLNHIICDANIIYENGAVVKTSFVTTYDNENIIESCPELTRRINDVTDKLRKQKVKAHPKYQYPDNVVTTAMVQKYARYGVPFSVRQCEAVRIGALDAQRKKGKDVFGGGLLVTEKAAAEKAAAEKAAAEKAAAEKWQLSEREKDMIRYIEERMNAIE